VQRIKSLAEFGFEPRYIVDVGANVGGWTDQIIHFFPNAYFLMVEANSKHEPHLKNICEKHDTVDYSISLLSNLEKDLPFYMIKNAHPSDAESGNSLLRERTHHYANDKNEVKIIKSTTLDALISKKEIPRVDFLKLDVQGSEVMVLEGALKVLQNVTFCLMEVQLQQWNDKAPLCSEVISFMSSKGFQPYDVIDQNRASNYTISIDFLFKKDDDKYLCPNII
jgi:FkbM family methyltransferase